MILVVLGGLPLELCDLGAHTSPLSVLIDQSLNHRPCCGYNGRSLWSNCTCRVSRASGVLPPCPTRNVATLALAEMGRPCPLESEGGLHRPDPTKWATRNRPPQETWRTLATFKLMVWRQPLSPCNMMPATCGCLFCTMGRQSAQLAQWGSNSRSHGAIPVRPCSRATTPSHQTRMTSGTSKIRPKHTRTSWSCAMAKIWPDCAQPAICSGCSAEEQQEPCRLHV